MKPFAAVVCIVITFCVTTSKATEAKVLNMEPFLPKPADKPLIEISNFKLHTDKRAEDRANYDQQKKKKEVL